MTLFISTLLKKKQQNKAITMLTAYDFLTAVLLEKVAVDMILVGDSLGNVFCGQETTLAVTVDQMIYHATLVKRGAPNSFIVLDMPFMSHRISIEKTKENAQKMLQNTGVSA